MTLVTAWVRQNSSLHELVIASDSRIGGGGAWEACPKIVPLPRPATVIAMSGDAVESYAFLLHAINTCHLLEGHRVGRTDLRYLAKKLRDTYADFPSHFHKLVPWEKKPKAPNLKVALFGWSWRRLAFEGYSFSYNRSGVLIMDSIGTLATHRPYPHYLMGDAKSDARVRLNNLAERRRFPIPLRGDPDAPNIAANAFYDWEPLEILLDVIGDRKMDSVGGMPQIARVYQNGECELFVWRAPDGTDHFGGRPVQAAERFDRRIIELGDKGVKISFSDRSIYFGGGVSDNPMPDQAE
jgi:hypothetical protein